MKRPAKNPCGSCPYRRDVPSGVWSEDEYAKLPEFDKPTAEQPPTVFLCHQQDGRICSGWAAVHDMDESMGLRIASVADKITPDDLEATRNHTTPVAVFATGAEAAEHGLHDLYTPTTAARRTADKVRRRQRRVARST